jgi:hypothetical protein
MIARPPLGPFRFPAEGRGWSTGKGRPWRALWIVALIVLVIPLAARGEDAAGHHPFLAAPVWVYNNWSAYDELSDEVPLTEELAMRELRELLRLRRAGVRVDYYVMDAFWYDPDGGYRVWRKDWPNGPDPWLAACAENGIKPGLWFGTNSLVHLNAVEKWRDSLSAAGDSMALYRGGFLADFMDVLQYWYDRGIRLFKLDFADFAVAPKGEDQGITPARLRERNRRALRAALAAFRKRNPDAVLVAFNGFVGDVDTAKSVVSHSDANWLDVFDTLYAGDPRPANVPEMNFWRSVDIYSDRMVRRFELAGVPLPRVDSTGFMIGDTGTNYGRRTSGWRGMAILTMARGGWINTIHGNLEFLDEADLSWLAKAQALFDGVQKTGALHGFGGFAGDRDPYGYAAALPQGGLYVVVNPAQAVQRASLPRLPRDETPAGRILFHDAGFVPVLEEHALRLGPGQLAVVGFGRYADPAYDLGVNGDIRIPLAIEQIPARFTRVGDGLVFRATVAVPATGDVRVIMRQRTESGQVMRSISPGNMGEFFTIRASQDGRTIPVAINYDKKVWSGLSWAAGEIRRHDLDPGEKLTLTLTSQDKDTSMHLEAQVYRVEYGP